MRVRNRRMAALAAAVCFGVMGIAKASPADDFSLNSQLGAKPLYLDGAATATPPPPKPLTEGLDKVGVKTGPFSLYGFVEGSYPYGLSSPPNTLLSGRVLDRENQECTLNQAEL